MRIAFIGEKIYPLTVKGAENYVQEVSLCMSQMGHDVFVYALKSRFDQKISDDKSIKVISLPDFTEKFGEWAQTLWATVDAISAKYDVVHFQSKKTFFASKLVKLFNRDCKIVSSFDLQCDFQSKPGVVVFETYGKNSIAKWNLRNKRYMLLADKFEKQSGAHFLIEAFKKLEDSAKTPNNFKLVLAITEEGDEDYVRYLHTISSGRTNIVFVEDISQKNFWQLISNAYLYIDPSIERQAASAHLAKAMLCGVTPLVSNIKENLEVVGREGFSFESKSLSDLESKLAYLLSRSDEVEKVGKLAREKIEKEYGWGKIAQKTIETLKI